MYFKLSAMRPEIDRNDGLETLASPSASESLSINNIFGALPPELIISLQTKE